jgi:hypothetical protein
MRFLIELSGLILAVTGFFEFGGESSSKAGRRLEVERQSPAD